MDEKSGRYNCGWNLTREQWAAITLRLEKWTPQNQREKRDKHICELAFRQNMNASQIARIKGDPLLVGFGNRNRGQIGRSGVMNIIHAFAPETDRRKGYSKTPKERSYLWAKRQRGEIRKPKICAACGAKEALELHHIIPLAAGGNDENYNLIFLCHSCHWKLHIEIYKKISFKNSLST